MLMSHLPVTVMVMAAAAIINCLDALSVADAFAPSPFMHHRSLASLLDATTSCIPSTATEQAEATSATPAITERFITLAQNPNATIIIDMENVRGKTSFELDHADFLDRLLIWTSRRGFTSGRTIVVADHGSRSSAHLLRGGGGDAAEGSGALCVAFAGPHAKADDVIARDVRWLLSPSSETTTAHVVVITADRELAWRCRSAVRLPAESDEGGRTKLNSILRSFAVDDAGYRTRQRKQRGKKGRKKSRAARKRQYSLQQQEEAEEGQSDEDEGDDAKSSGAGNTTMVNAASSSNDEDQQHDSGMPTVEVIAPQRFLEDLEQALQEWLSDQRPVQHAQADGEPSSAMPTPVSTLQSLFNLRGQILSIESSLRKKCSLRKRHMLTEELRECKEEWNNVLSTLTVAVEPSAVESGQLDVNQPSLAWSLAWSLSSSVPSWDGDGDGDDDSGTTAPLTPLPPSTSSSNSRSYSASWEKLTPSERESLLLRWGKRRGRRGTHRERTEDRIVLAERLRRQLELVFDVNPPNDVGRDCAVADEDTVPLVDLYAEYVNSIADP